MRVRGPGGLRDVDAWAVFAAVPTPYLLLTPDLIICEVNTAYLLATSRQRGDLMGRYLFDAFPDNPGEPEADGTRNLRASLERARDTGVPDTMPLQRYDIPVDAGGRTRWEERYWSPINTPVLDEAGRTVLLIHRVEDVTAYVRERQRLDHEQVTADVLRSRVAVAEADLFARAQELQAANERLRAAHDRERQVALTLQRAMLPAVVAVDGLDVATRYLPATDIVAVAGDWYEVTLLGEGCVGLAVGDVMGHGLAAAGVMGQLRSALAAAMLATSSPGAALDILDTYAQSLPEPTFATVVHARIDLDRRSLAYSNAGHPPPLLLHAGGATFLREGQAPPLATPHGLSGRPEARQPLPDGATLVLFTDGLVERRYRDIDAGLEHLAGVARSAVDGSAEELADAVLEGVLPEGGAPDDDVALVVIRV